MNLKPGTRAALQWGKKTKKGVKYEKYRRAKRAQRWPGEGERAPPFTLSPPKTTLPFFRPLRFFFLFPPMRSLVPNSLVFLILICRVLYLVGIPV